MIHTRHASYFPVVITILSVVNVGLFRATVLVGALHGRPFEPLGASLLGSAPPNAGLCVKPVCLRRRFRVHQTAPFLPIRWYATKYSG